MYHQRSMGLRSPYPLGPPLPQPPTAGTAASQRGDMGLSDPDIDCGYRARSAGAACGLQQTLLGQAPLGFAGGCCLCQSRDSKWTRERVQAEGTAGAHTEKCGGCTGRAPCGSMNISLEQRDVGDRNEFVPKQCWCISAARQPRGWGC